jgi:hypothetical protein
MQRDRIEHRRLRDRHQHPRRRASPRLDDQAVQGVRKRKLHIGTTFTFTLTAAATVTLKFTNTTHGRLVAGRCVGQNRRDQHRPKCSNRQRAGYIPIHAIAGRNQLRFDGRVRQHPHLTPGSYTVIATASIGTQTASSLRLRFTIAS